MFRIIGLRTDAQRTAPSPARTAQIQVNRARRQTSHQEVPGFTCTVPEIMSHAIAPARSRDFFAAAMSAPSSLTTVFVAGYGNSGADHWQRRWHEQMPGSLWVEQP